MRHRTSDPACVQHRPPTGWFSRWRFDRNRGRSCKPCQLERFSAIFAAAKAANPSMGAPVILNPDVLTED